LVCYCEAAAYGGLYLLDRYRNVAFRPADTLAPQQVEQLERLLSDDTTYLEHNSSLGWIIRPNAQKGPYRANAEGIRGDREYSLVAPGHRIRIASFGDSFTHGDDVANDATWQSALDRLQPNMEVINFGVSGYGLDQSFLRYVEQGVGYQPGIVLIGFLPESIFRQVNNFRPFYSKETGIPLSKPRYVLQADKLSLLANPLPTLPHYRRLLDNPRSILPQLGEQDYFYPLRYKSSVLDVSAVVRLFKMAGENIVRSIRDPYSFFGTSYDPDSEAFGITTRIFREFYAAVQQHGSQPVIVIFPLWRDIKRYARDATTSYAPLLSHFDEQGYRYIDLVRAFPDLDKYGRTDLFVGHYSPFGNRLIAEYIYGYLQSQQLLGFDRQ
jgi:hypothetical protein